MIHKITGKLVLKEGKSYEYGMYSSKWAKYYNVSELLEKIFKSETPKVSIRIVSDKHWDLLFDQSGELYLYKDSSGVYCWHINNVCLGKILFENVDNALDIIINDYLDESY